MKFLCKKCEKFDLVQKTLVFAVCSACFYSFSLYPIFLDLISFCSHSCKSFYLMLTFNSYTFYECIFVYLFVITVTMRRFDLLNWFCNFLFCNLQICFPAAHFSLVFPHCRIFWPHKSARICKKVPFPFQETALCNKIHQPSSASIRSTAFCSRVKSVSR